MKHAFIILSLFLTLAAEPALAAIPVPETEDNREASFLPPPVKISPEGASTSEKLEPPVKLDNLTKGDKKDVAPPPSLTEPPPFHPAAKAEPITIIEAARPAAPPAPEKMDPVSLGQPVAAKPLAQIDPEAIGLLAQESGGLGASVWKDTSRLLVDKLLPAVGLPTASPTLNDLARRLLLTTAAVPETVEGYKPPRSLTSLRVEKLLSLGAVQEAWEMSRLVEPTRLDAITLRLLTEAAIIGSNSEKVCEKVPAFMAANTKSGETGIEWQKALIICKMRAKDDGAVQLGVDLLREQGAKDDIFLSLMSRNILGGVKTLPRQLTPLRATTLAALRQIDLPLPPELYARPEAALIPELLLTKGTDDNARLALAERAAAQGIGATGQLASAYKSAVFTPEEIAGANASTEKTPRSRALAYQAAFHEQSPQKKIELIERMLENVAPDMLTGGLSSLAADGLEAIVPSTDYNTVSARMARLMALAGRTDKAMAWLKIVEDVKDRLPDVGKLYAHDWPLFVLSGLVPDGDYAAGLKKWLEVALTANETATDREQRERTGRILLILSASGYAVPDEIWTRVIEAVPASKQLVAAPLLTERLNVAARAERKGETVLLSLLVAGDGAEKTPLPVLADVLRALRQTGLKAEALSLSREAIIGDLVKRP